MVWLVAAIPATSVVAGIALLVAAARSSGGDDAVADPVRRTAQVQVVELAPDVRAAQQRMAMVVRRGKGLLEALPASGTFVREVPMRLTLRHPTRAQLDRTLTLVPSANGWQVEAGLDLGHDWLVDITPVDCQWRLRGRWPAGQLAVHLRPAVAAMELAR